MLSDQECEIFIHLIVKKACDDINIHMIYWPDPCIGRSYLSRAFDYCTRSKDDQQHFLHLLIWNFRNNIKNRCVGPKYGILQRSPAFILLDKYVLCILQLHFGILNSENDITATQVFKIRKRKVRLNQRLRKLKS